MQSTIDLNADLGESFGAYRMGDDETLVPLLTSANVACGFHAGDPLVIDHTVRLLKAAGVALGAHPGFGDLVGFGRRDLGASHHQIETDVAYQVAAMAGMGRRVGVTLRHVKAHGALYNLAWRDQAVAAGVAAGVASLDLSLILVAPSGSALERAAGAAGLRVAREAFADRAYAVDGTLVPRHLPGAVLEDPSQVAERAVQIAREGEIGAVDGSLIELRADTICIHGDNPAAVALATAVRQALKSAGVGLRAMSAALGPLGPDSAPA
ncbi:MAG: LamB/YcsF family protein [Candidatus Dormibacteria bacterium]